MSSSYLLLPLLHDGHHDLWLVRDCEDDLGDARLLEGLDLVHHDGLVREGHQRLGAVKRQGAQTRPEPTNKNQSFHPAKKYMKGGGQVAIVEKEEGERGEKKREARSKETAAGIFDSYVPGMAWM